MADNNNNSEPPGLKPSPSTTVTPPSSASASRTTTTSSSSSSVHQGLVPSQAVSSRNRNNNNADKSNSNNRRRNRRGRRKSNDAGDGNNTNTAPATPAMNAEAKEFVPPTPQEGAGGENNGKKRGKRRGGRGRRGKNSMSPMRGNAENGAAATAPADSSGDAKPSVAPSAGEDAPPAGEPKKRRQRQRRRGNKNTNTDGNEINNNNTNKKDRKTNRRRGGGGGNKKFSWRKQIPPGTVDPISLESLKSLKYPPFALAATAPYTPITEWPEIPSEKLEERKEDGKESGGEDDLEKRQKRILEEQWGKVLTGDVLEDGEAAPANPDDTKESSTTGTNKRYYHLFDGRVLAYYLVSQLQFIDPMNRRDLTRDELLNLDAYLRRHRLGRAGVVEAYDARGLTISTAGAAGQTAGGRAQILQQEAQSLLASLFSGGGAVQQGEDVAQADFQNDFERQYMAHERRQQQQQRGRRGNTQQTASGGEEEDVGIYAPDHGGMLIIDDDENPGLRGGFSQVANEETERDGGAVAIPSTLYSARHIAEMHGHGARAHADNFPALPAAAANSAVVSDNDRETGEATAPAKPPAAGATSRSLKSISKAVKKTDPAEVARQKKAREEAQRRAALSKLSYVDPSLGDASGAIDTNQGVASANREAFTASAGPTEGQLLRNRAMADALGVAPSTVRINAGWARPVVTEIKLDEFGNELGAAQYPDSLILDARDKYMGELLKLERRWKAFLADDKAASLPLRSMHRDLRKFVHEYSDFWRLHTESFDPEPRRYVHCVKLRDTSAPFPLLSEAVRKWRGPGTGAVVPAATVSLPSSKEQAVPSGNRSLAVPPEAPIASSPIHLKQVVHLEQTAGQSTTSRELTWMYEDRVPLELAPRSVPFDAPPGAMFDLDSTNVPAEEQAGTTETQANSRFSNLHSHDKRERVRLNLAPRTVPRELPEYRPPPRSTYDASDAMERVRDAKQAERKRLQQKEEARRAVLAEAFASDSESEDEKVGSGGKVYARQTSDSSSDWEEEEALYHGSDEDE